MRVIQLDGRNWETPCDFLQALLEGIQQGHPHGLSIDAFVDSMIWGGMGGIEPPYTVQIVNISDAPKAVIDEVSALSSAIKAARVERHTRDGTDIDVAVSYAELAV